MTLQLCVPRCAHASFAAACDDDRSDLPEPPADPTPDPPIDDDEWDEPDPTRFDDDAFLDFCEIDDAPDPDPRDYWDDSLDREWNCAVFGNRNAEFGVSRKRELQVTPHSASA